jgi:hypothetical protein
MIYSANLQLTLRRPIDYSLPSHRVMLMEPMKEIKILSLVSSLTSLSCTYSHNFDHNCTISCVSSSSYMMTHELLRQGFICIFFVLVISHIHLHIAHTFFTFIMSSIWLLILSYACITCTYCINIPYYFFSLLWLNSQPVPLENAGLRINCAEILQISSVVQCYIPSRYNFVLIE